MLLALLLINILDKNIKFLTTGRPKFQNIIPNIAYNFIENNSISSL